jgi:hypothetical protein
MANLDEMEQALVKCKDKVEGVVVDDFEDEDTMIQDIYDSMGLLNQSMHLLDYLSDPDLCRAVSKRERDSMARLSDRIRLFLDNMNAAYEEHE